MFGQNLYMVPDHQKKPFYPKKDSIVDISDRPFFLSVQVFNPAHGLDVVYVYVTKISLSSRQVCMPQNHLTHNFEGCSGS